MFNLTNLMTVFSVLIIIIQLLEQLLGEGTGPQKKEAVIEAIKEIVTKLKLNVPDIIMQNLGVIVDVIVMLFNKFGPFKKIS